VLLQRKTQRNKFYLSTCNTKGVHATPVSGVDIGNLEYLIYAAQYLHACHSMLQSFVGRPTVCFTTCPTQSTAKGPPFARITASTTTVPFNIM
jgi:hypothetical protein